MVPMDPGLKNVIDDPDLRYRPRPPLSTSTPAHAYSPISFVLVAGPDVRGFILERDGHGQLVGRDGLGVLFHVQALGHVNGALGNRGHLDGMERTGMDIYSQAFLLERLFISNTTS